MFDVLLGNCTERLPRKIYSYIQCWGQYFLWKKSDPYPTQFHIVPFQINKQCMIVYELILNIVCVPYENSDPALYGYILSRHYSYRRYQLSIQYNLKILLILIFFQIRGGGFKQKDKKTRSCGPGLLVRGGRGEQTGSDHKAEAGSKVSARLGQEAEAEAQKEVK